MDVLIYSSQPFERPFLDAAASARGHRCQHQTLALNASTAALANGFSAVSLFVNDDGSAAVLQQLAAGGTRLLALRSAGFNHVDLNAAKALQLAVARVPAYSPYAVAEHTVGLILTLNRKLHRAFARVREQNFSLNGLLGFDLHGKTVGIIGTGQIGSVLARIMSGFGCTVLATDPIQNRDCLALGVRYVTLPELLQQSDIVSLHCPLTAATQHLINSQTLAQMKPGAMLINTGRGALIDSKAVIVAIKSGQLGALGMDVYEEEAGLFFADHSGDILTDDVLARLMTFPNVFITGHQGFFTREALQNIAETTMTNVSAFAAGTPNGNWLS
ncbi:2-hydroxyacid dehydrogenase [Permianibacter sp. IMCC34836]|uniref:2-hydroxyacid dehydrogenase n=1 Tax=Permianibacter fluminis TaxID=2738515 RepID=UPI0015530E36|nr:2-hydroxyacid dehydrogenase [Permianibacter fluminis]NQD36408.1 2-hydroxyacid dehydrogenase [Permianibacter fluminis]